MTQKKQSEINKRFQAALVWLLDEEGRGAQAKLCRKTGLNSGYLSSIVNGKSASDEAAETIATYFGYTYEEMLTIGRWCLAGKKRSEMSIFLDKNLIQLYRQYSSLSKEDRAILEDIGNSVAIQLAIQEQLKEKSNQFSIKGLAKRVKLSVPETKAALESSEALLDHNFITAAVGYLEKSKYELVISGRYILTKTPYSPSLLTGELLNADQELLEISSRVEHEFPGSGNEFILNILQINKDRDMLPKKQVEDLLQLAAARKGELKESLLQHLEKKLTLNIPDNSNIVPGPGITGQVPLISWVQAGAWAEVVDNFQPGDADEWLRSTVNVSVNAFALRISGDSMIPEFLPGETIIVDPDVQPETGSYVVAKIDNGGTGESGEATFKQFIRDGNHIYLKPLNSEYKTQDMTGKDFRIVGCVVEKRKAY